MLLLIPAAGVLIILSLKNSDKSSLDLIVTGNVGIGTTESMLLAISSDLQKEKLVKYDNAGLDEAQKAIQ